MQKSYANQIESLHACLGIWKCVGVMVESPDQVELAREVARQAVATALAELKTMDGDNPGFRGKEAWTKETWRGRLEWIQLQLNAPAPISRPNSQAN